MSTTPTRRCIAASTCKSAHRHRRQMPRKQPDNWALCTTLLVQSPRISSNFCPSNLPTSQQLPHISKMFPQKIQGKISLRPKRKTSMRWRYKIWVDKMWKVQNSRKLAQFSIKNKKTKQSSISVVIVLKTRLIIRIGPILNYNRQIPFFNPSCPSRITHIPKPSTSIKALTIPP